MSSIFLPVRKVRFAQERFFGANIRQYENNCPSGVLGWMKWMEKLTFDL
jgi:hypothetical protein